MPGPNPEVEILLPVHNEAESIEATIREIHAELSPRLAIRFIVCEDGSRDNTQDVLTKLATELPMKLIMSKARKGYSRAVRDGMESMVAPYLLCLDSDGQCDPRDFWPIWNRRESSDVVIGHRVSRADNWLRRYMSRTFFAVYQILYNTPVHDPSCPFVLAPRTVIQSLACEMGAMEQGFWWEFVARVHRRGFTIQELPINHRVRSAGETQVYSLRKLPGIGWRHFLALGRIWRETRRPK